MTSEYFTEVYDSVKKIDPQEWHSLIDSRSDLAMDLRLIHLLENTLSDQAKFWVVVIRDNQQQVIACACLSVFQTDILQSSSGFLQKAIQRLRLRWPNALKLKVLFCGLPLPSGHTHLRVRPAVDPLPILQLLTTAMTTIARQEKARMLVFKELADTQVQQTRCLQTLGFSHGELEPIYQLSGDFKDFVDYHGAMRSCYRHQISGNLKKFNQMDMRVEHIVCPEQIYLQFSDAVHRLYLNVWERAKEKLECFPAKFFRELGRAMPGQIALTIISHEDKPVAFSIGIMNKEEYHNLYVGLDYSYLKPVDLYFNLFYQELDAVFRAKKQKIWLGQTSRAFKSRLGAIANPRFFWVRPLNPLLKLIFKYFQKLIFPKVEAVQSFQVFKKSPS